MVADVEFSMGKGFGQSILRVMPSEMTDKVKVYSRKAQ